jgi:acetyltransferase
VTVASGGVVLESVDPQILEAVLPGLVALLVEAVDDGASVGFLGPLSSDAAEAYWRERSSDVARGSRVLIVARRGDEVLGTVQLAFAAQENGAHRAEVQRLLVRRASRRAGLGTALMRELERVALERGRTLLFLNTRTGDPPEALYYRLGYSLVGYIPRFARNPDGTFNTTSIMFRHLDAT